jgi:hypothetical protein
VASLPAGIYTLRLAATDRAGNETTARVRIRVGLDGSSGDVNGNGRVDVADALLALRASIGLTQLTPQQAAAADLLPDGRVTVADATRILRLAVGLG